MEITHNNLPKAFSILMQKVEKIEQGLHDILSPSPNDSFPEIMQAPKAANFLDITEQTVRIKCNKNELPFMKKHGRLFFFKAELIDYLKTGRKATQSETMKASAVVNGFKARK